MARTYKLHPHLRNRTIAMPHRLVALLLVAALPACVFATGNRATTQDVEKPRTDPGIPESKFATVDFVQGDISDVIYQAPPDRALILRDVLASSAVDLVADVAGNLITIAPWWAIFDPAHPGMHLGSGVKLPPGAALRARRTSKTSAESPVQILIAGELVRM
jgi:hypothetical protein